VRGGLYLELCDEPLSRIAADVALVGVFHKQRPLRGGAGLVDWRLCGWLSTLIREGQLTGEPDSWMLVPSGGRLGAPRVLVGGLGDSAALGSAALRQFSATAAERIAKLAAREAVVDLAMTSQSLSQESAAASVVAGFGETLSALGAELVLRCAVSESEHVRWRVVLERAAAKHRFRDFSFEVGSDETPREPRTVRRADAASLGR